MCLQCTRSRFDSWVEMIPWRREWQPTPIFLPGKSQGQRSLAGYSPWGRWVGYDWETNTFTFFHHPAISVCRMKKKHLGDRPWSLTHYFWILMVFGIWFFPLSCLLSSPLPFLLFDFFRALSRKDSQEIEVPLRIQKEYLKMCSSLWAVAKPKQFHCLI